MMNFILLLFYLVTTIGLSDNPKELKWLSLEEGLQEAKQTDKKIVVNIYTTWCGWCKKMDKNVYGNRKIINYIDEKFLAVKLNAESNAEVEYKDNKYSERIIARAFGVTGYPATAFLTPKGELITTVPGFIPADRFLDILIYIAEDYFKEMSWEEFLKTRENIKQ